MEYEWDEAKRHTNLAKHGVDFADVATFDWDSAIEEADTRRLYGENRWRAVGLIGSTLFMLIFTKRSGRTRVISLRKASRKEKADYAEDKA